MTHTTLILGGARSGKSRFSEDMARDSGLTLHYIATGRAWDDEMRARISQHRVQRGDGWMTHEEPLELAALLARLDDAKNAVLIDCLTLWVTNMMMAGRDMAPQFAELCAHVATARARLFFVSNEVGLGIVPENRMARDFRDHSGRLHQMVAAAATHVYFIAAGLPLKMKG